jgi:alcohol dehydrogenase class IV
MTSPSTSFEFTTANRIIFGTGKLKDVAAVVSRFGKRALVVTGSQPQRAHPLLDLLQAGGIDCVTFAVSGEPDVTTVQSGVAQARQSERDVIIGIGGGAVIDAGKAISGLLTNDGDLFDYLEVIGKGQALKNAATPYIAIPTTAGTGAEVTSNAVIYSPEHRVKVSLRHPLMLPRVALVDPELTYTSPPAVTASSGLDAITQVIEAFVSNKANPLTDSLCREGIQRGARSLRRAYEHGNDAAAREDMAITSLFSGIALSNAKLGAVHGFAGPMGGMFSIPHGAVCACLLPHVMLTNVQALTARQPDNAALRRYAEVAQIITGRPDATAEDGVAWVRELCQAVDIKPLSAFNITASDFPAIIEKSAVSSSMQGNPIKLTADEMGAILQAAL